MVAGEGRIRCFVFFFFFQEGGSRSGGNAKVDSFTHLYVWIAILLGLLILFNKKREFNQEKNIGTIWEKLEEIVRVDCRQIFLSHLSSPKYPHRHLLLIMKVLPIA